MGMSIRYPHSMNGKISPDRIEVSFEHTLIVGVKQELCSRLDNDTGVFSTSSKHDTTSDHCMPVDGTLCMERIA